VALTGDAMNHERLEAARLNAARDICYRWFAFMDGKTESLVSHLDMFSLDIILMHTAIYRVAYDKGSMARWLESLAAETGRGSHFIRELDVVSFDQNTAELAMRVSYQRCDGSGEIGGALTDYKARVRFNNDQTAVFTYLQKTPQFQNLDREFKDSFPENRLYSFMNHLRHLMAASKAEALRDLVDNGHFIGAINELITDTQTADMARVEIEQVDVPTATFTLALQAQDQAKRFQFQMVERGGRYLRILSVCSVPPRA
jgi:hypothetical protein